MTMVFHRPEQAELEFDDFDKELLAKKMAMINGGYLPNVGEFVILADRSIARIAGVFDSCVAFDIAGDYFIGDGFISHEGNITGALSFDDMLLKQKVMPGHVWFYHHDTYGPFQKMTRIVNLRVWKASHMRECPRGGECTFGVRMIGSKLCYVCTKCFNQ